MRDRHPAQVFVRRIAWSAPYLVVLSDGRARRSRELASFAGVSLSSTTRHLRGLRRLGLVAGEPNPEGPELAFRLTPVGLSWLERPLVESCHTLKSSKRGKRAWGV